MLKSSVVIAAAGTSRV